MLGKLKHFLGGFAHHSHNHNHHADGEHTSSPATSTTSAKHSTEAPPTAFGSGAAVVTTPSAPSGLPPLQPIATAPATAPVGVSAAPQSAFAVVERQETSENNTAAATTAEDLPQGDDEGVIDFLDLVISGDTETLRKKLAEDALRSATTPSIGATTLSQQQPLAAADSFSSSMAGHATATGSAAPDGGRTSSTYDRRSPTQPALSSAPGVTATRSCGRTPNGTAVATTTTVVPASRSGGTSPLPSGQRYVSSAARSLQDYELVAYLGSGTFAEVTLARHRRTNQLFAIKKISKQKVKEEGCVERTYTERRLLASLRHPFLVRMYQAFQSRTHLYFVLDFAQGGDLYYFNEEKLWVRDVQRTLHHVRYPYYRNPSSNASFLPTVAQGVDARGSPGHVRRRQSSRPLLRLTAAAGEGVVQSNSGQLGSNLSFGTIGADGSLLRTPSPRAAGAAAAAAVETAANSTAPAIASPKRRSHHHQARSSTQSPRASPSRSHPEADHAKGVAHDEKGKAATAAGATSSSSSPPLPPQLTVVQRLDDRAPGSSHEEEGGDTMSRTLPKPIAVCTTPTATTTAVGGELAAVDAGALSLTAPSYSGESGGEAVERLALSPSLSSPQHADPYGSLNDDRLSSVGSKRLAGFPLSTSPPAALSPTSTAAQRASASIALATAAAIANSPMGGAGSSASGEVPCLPSFSSSAAHGAASTSAGEPSISEEPDGVSAAAAAGGGGRVATTASTAAAGSAPEHLDRSDTDPSSNTSQEASTGTGGTAVLAAMDTAAAAVAAAVVADAIANLSEADKARYFHQQFKYSIASPLVFGEMKGSTLSSFSHNGTPATPTGLAAQPLLQTQSSYSSATPLSRPSSPAAAQGTTLVSQRSSTPTVSTLQRSTHVNGALTPPLTTAEGEEKGEVATTAVSPASGSATSAALHRVCDENVGTSVSAAAAAAAVVTGHTTERSSVVSSQSPSTSASPQPAPQAASGSAKKQTTATTTTTKRSGAARVTTDAEAASTAKTATASAAPAPSAKSAATGKRSVAYAARAMEDSNVSLPELAPDSSRFPLRLIAFYAVELGLVLQYLHAEGFLYRDLKPENILMRRDGHVMLTDFGVAKFRKGAAIQTVSGGGATGASSAAASTSAGATAATAATAGEKKEERTASFTGTAQYMSPEMLQGLPHDSRTDWWSYGCLLFEWCNGRKAFDATNQFALFRSIVEEDVRVDEAVDFRLTALELHSRVAQLHYRYLELTQCQEQEWERHQQKLMATTSSSQKQQQQQQQLAQSTQASSVTVGEESGRVSAPPEEEGDAVAVGSVADSPGKPPLVSRPTSSEPSRAPSTPQSAATPTTTAAAAHRRPPPAPSLAPGSFGAVSGGTTPVAAAAAAAAAAAVVASALTGTPNPSFRLDGYNSSFGGGPAAAVAATPPANASDQLSAAVAAVAAAVTAPRMSALTPSDRDVYLQRSLDQMQEALDLLKDLILSLLRRNQESRLSGSAVLDHPFFHCAYVLSQLYYHYHFNQLRNDDERLSFLLYKNEVSDIVVTGDNQYALNAATKDAMKPAATAAPTPTTNQATSQTEVPKPTATTSEQISLCSSPSATPSPQRYLRLVSTDDFLNHMPRFARPENWTSLFLNLEIVPPYCPRLRAPDDLCYFPRAVTATGLSAAVDQQKRLEEAKKAQREWMMQIAAQAVASSGVVLRPHRWSTIDHPPETSSSPPLSSEAAGAATAVAASVVSGTDGSARAARTPRGDTRDNSVVVAPSNAAAPAAMDGSTGESRGDTRSASSKRPAMRVGLSRHASYDDVQVELKREKRHKKDKRVKVPIVTTAGEEKEGGKGERPPSAAAAADAAASSSRHSTRPKSSRQARSSPASAEPTASEVSPQRPPRPSASSTPQRDTELAMVPSAAGGAAVTGDPRGVESVSPASISFSSGLVTPQGERRHRHHHHHHRHPHRAMDSIDPSERVGRHSHSSAPHQHCHMQDGDNGDSISHPSRSDSLQHRSSSSRTGEREGVEGGSEEDGTEARRGKQEDVVRLSTSDGASQVNASGDGAAKEGNVRPESPTASTAKTETVATANTTAAPPMQLPVVLPFSSANAGDRGEGHHRSEGGKRVGPSGDDDDNDDTSRSTPTPTANELHILVPVRQTSGMSSTKGDGNESGSTVRSSQTVTLPPNALPPQPPAPPLSKAVAHSFSRDDSSLRSTSPGEDAALDNRGAGVENRAHHHLHRGGLPPPSFLDHAHTYMHVTGERDAEEEDRGTRSPHSSCSTTITTSISSAKSAPTPVTVGLPTASSPVGASGATALLPLPVAVSATSSACTPGQVGSLLHSPSSVSSTTPTRSPGKETATPTSQRRMRRSSVLSNASSNCGGKPPLDDDEFESEEEDENELLARTAVLPKEFVAAALASVSAERESEFPRPPPTPSAGASGGAPHSVLTAVGVLPPVHVRQNSFAELVGASGTNTLSHIARVPSLAPQSLSEPFLASATPFAGIGAGGGTAVAGTPCIGSRTGSTAGVPTRAGSVSPSAGSPTGTGPRSSSNVGSAGDYYYECDALEDTEVEDSPREGRRATTAVMEDDVQDGSDQAATAAAMRSVLKGFSVTGLADAPPPRKSLFVVGPDISAVAPHTTPSLAPAAAAAAAPSPPMTLPTSSSSSSGGGSKAPFASVITDRGVAPLQMMTRVSPSLPSPSVVIIASATTASPAAVPPLAAPVKIVPSVCVADEVFDAAPDTASSPAPLCVDGELSPSRRLSVASANGSSLSPGASARYVGLAPLPHPLSDNALPKLSSEGWQDDGTPEEGEEGEEPAPVAPLLHISVTIDEAEHGVTTAPAEAPSAAEQTEAKAAQKTKDATATAASVSVPPEVVLKAPPERHTDVWSRQPQHKDEQEALAGSGTDEFARTAIYEEEETLHAAVASSAFLRRAMKARAPGVSEEDSGYDEDDENDANEQQLNRHSSQRHSDQEEDSFISSDANQRQQQRQQQYEEMAKEGSGKEGLGKPARRTSASAFRPDRQTSRLSGSHQLHYRHHRREDDDTSSPDTTFSSSTSSSSPSSSSGSSSFLSTSPSSDEEEEEEEEDSDVSTMDSNPVIPTAGDVSSADDANARRAERAGEHDTGDDLDDRSHASSTFSTTSTSSFLDDLFMGSDADVNRSFGGTFNRSFGAAGVNTSFGACSAHSVSGTSVGGVGGAAVSGVGPSSVAGLSAAAWQRHLRHRLATSFAPLHGLGGVGGGGMPGAATSSPGGDLNSSSAAAASGRRLSYMDGNELAATTAAVAAAAAVVAGRHHRAHHPQFFLSENALGEGALQRGTGGGERASPTAANHHSHHHRRDGEGGHGRHIPTAGGGGGGGGGRPSHLDGVEDVLRQALAIAEARSHGDVGVVGGGAETSSDPASPPFAMSSSPPSVLSGAGGMTAGAAASTTLRDLAPSAAAAAAGMDQTLDMGTGEFYAPANTLSGIAYVVEDEPYPSRGNSVVGTPITNTFTRGEAPPAAPLLPPPATAVVVGSASSAGDTRSGLTKSGGGSSAGKDRLGSTDGTSSSSSPPPSQSQPVMVRFGSGSPAPGTATSPAPSPPPFSSSVGFSPSSSPPPSQTTDGPDPTNTRSVDPSLSATAGTTASSGATAAGASAAQPTGTSPSTGPADPLSSQPLSQPQVLVRVGGPPGSALLPTVPRRMGGLGGGGGGGGGGYPDGSSGGVDHSKNTYKWILSKHGRAGSAAGTSPASSPTPTNAPSAPSLFMGGGSGDGGGGGGGFQGLPPPAAAMPGATTTGPSQPFASSNNSSVASAAPPGTPGGPRRSTFTTSDTRKPSLLTMGAQPPLGPALLRVDSAANYNNNSSSGGGGAGGGGGSYTSPQLLTPSSQFNTNAEVNYGYPSMGYSGGYANQQSTAEGPLGWATPSRSPSLTTGSGFGSASDFYSPAQPLPQPPAASSSSRSVASTDFLGFTFDGRGFGGGGYLDANRNGGEETPFEGFGPDPFAQAPPQRAPPRYASQPQQRYHPPLLSNQTQQQQPQQSAAAAAAATSTSSLRSRGMSSSMASTSTPSQTSPTTMLSEATGNAFGPSASGGFEPFGCGPGSPNGGGGGGGGMNPPGDHFTNFSFTSPNMLNQYYAAGGGVSPQ